MEAKLYNQKHILISIFIIILIEIIDLLSFILYPDNTNALKYSQPLLLVGTVILFVFIIRGITRTSKELSTSNQKLNSIFDSLDVAIWSHDLKEDILLISSGIQNLYGYQSDEFYKDKLLWKKVIYPDDLHLLTEREKLFQTGNACTSIYRIIRSDGKVRWIQDRGIPTLDDKGEMVYFTSVLFDITDRKESEDLYRSLVEMSPDIISVISNSKFDYINNAGSKVLGARNPEELIGRKASEFASTDIITSVKNKLKKDFAKGNFEVSPMEVQVEALDGQIMDIEVTAMPITYGGKSAFQLVGRDITNRKKSEKIIHEMAYYDALTNIPNRNMFKQQLHHLLNDSLNDSFAILFLDLDRFKMINDTKGHSIGDLLLKKVATHLKDIVQYDGEVFRQGGDEFIILLQNKNKEAVIEIANRIVQSFMRPFELFEQEFFVTTSIGISMYPEDGKDQESLIKRADTAMYLAKDQGKNNFQFYYHGLDKVTSKKMELENQLRKALEMDQFRLFYQPKVQLTTGEILGVEALIRWEHPDEGMISPLEFIPLAEETGLIIPIGKWVLKKACAQVKEWEQNGIGRISVAVNISVRQIQNENFVEEVKDILHEYDVHPSLIELEITESIMQDFERSANILNKLKEIGVMISIDDFGTGYSSLSNLKHLNIDNIKIDKSFIDDIIGASSQGSIVKAIIDMGDNLQFNIIAEGIEMEEQVQFLLGNGCEVGQGYYFSKPLPVDQVEHLLLGKMSLN